MPLKARKIEIVTISNKVSRESRSENQQLPVQLKASVRLKAREEALGTTRTNVFRETRREKPVETGLTRGYFAAEGTRVVLSDY